jgi:hypothetical protein
MLAADHSTHACPAGAVISLISIILLQVTAISLLHFPAESLCFAYLQTDLSSEIGFWRSSKRGLSMETAHLCGLSSTF